MVGIAIAADQKVDSNLLDVVDSSGLAVRCTWIAGGVIESVVVVAYDRRPPEPANLVLKFDSARC